MKKITNSSTAYWVYGNEQAPKTIILIHGYRGTHHGLELIAKELNKKNVYGGIIKLELYPSKAPETVSNFVTLINRLNNLTT